MYLHLDFSDSIFSCSQQKRLQEGVEKSSLGKRTREAIDEWVYVPGKKCVCRESKCKDIILFPH